MPSLDLREAAPWKQRFRAWGILSTQIAAGDARRGLAVSNRSGIAQLCAWDVATGALRELTDRPTGKMSGFLSPDGRFVYYLDDDAGNEIGHLVRVPYAGGKAEDVTPDLEPYALSGFAFSRDGTTLAFTAGRRDSFRLLVGALDRSGKLGPLREIHHATRLTRGPALSHGGELAVTATTEKTGTIEFGLVAIEVASGKLLGELVDDGSIEGGRFSRVPGDTRLLSSTTRSGHRRPLLWDPLSGQRTDLDLADLAGDVVPVGWTSDARRVLLRQVVQATTRLHLLDLESAALSAFSHPEGTVGSAYFHPDGDVIASVQSSERKARFYRIPPAGERSPPVLLEGGAAPPGRKWRSVGFPSSEGVTIQAWVATPEGDGPFPTILETHGGPSGVTTEVYAPRAQAWLDHGFAFATLNYRGSTTFGRAFQQAISGRLGHYEVDDMAAAHAWLVAEGIADPGRVLLTGWSYGGYLTLMALGTRPELWAGGMAGIAIADWTTMYEDESEPLRRYQAGLFGGTPDEKPEAHVASSPITYAEQVRAPVLVIQGRNDTRCPARQLELYEQKLQKLGKSIEVVWFDAGHGSYAIAQQIEHQERMLTFACDLLT